jgi:hypothetical protein
MAGNKIPVDVIGQLRREELGRLESTPDIWKRLPRARTGEAVLTKELIETFNDLLMEGNTRDNAARVVGLSRKRLSNWLAQGAKDIADERMTLEAELTWTIDRGEGEQTRQLVRSAFRAAMHPASDGTLALKILERRVPEDWAPALPDMSDGGASFVGLQRSALAEEARRILLLAAKDVTKASEMAGEVVPPEEKK